MGNQSNGHSRQKDGAALLGWLQPTLGKLEALYNLPAGLLRSVAITESSGEPVCCIRLLAPRGCSSLCPVRLGIWGCAATMYSTLKNAAAAAKYLSQLLKMKRWRSGEGPGVL